MKVVYTERAITDLETIDSYLRERSPSGARSVRAAFERTISQISRFPFLGRDSDIGGLLEIAVVRHPYRIFYEVVDRELWIIHVRDARRKPWEGGGD